MRALLIFVAAVVVIILGLWATLVLYFDEARLKQIATEQVRAQTGRELSIEGPLRLDVFPSMSLVARDVELSGPENYAGPALFSAEEFRMSLSLLPLLSGNVETGDIGLKQAELNIHTDRGGASSLDGLIAAEPEPEAGPAPKVSTGEILLANVRINVTDAATDARQVFVVDTLKIDSFRFDEPVPFSFEGSVGDPPVVENIDLTADVTVPSGAGPVQVSGLEVSALASGLDLALTGRAEVHPGPPMSARFSDGRVTLGENEFGATFSYVEAERPKIEAALDGEMLDVDALLAAMPAAGDEPAAEGGASDQAPEPSPLLLLRDLDVDATLDLDRMRISGLMLESIRARLVADRGVVTIDPLAGALAGGRLDAVALIDLNTEPPEVELSPLFDLESLGQALGPWGLDRFVTGAGVIDLELTARGLDPKSILGSLNGAGSYDFRDGSIKGLNLDGMVEALAARNLAEAARAGVGGSTAFRTFSGAVEIDQGTVRLPGMEIVTEMLGITGDVRLGLADLGLDGRIRLDGTRLDNLPIALGGTLTDPKLTPDVGEALKEEAGRRVMDFLKDRADDDSDGDNDGG